SRGIVDLTGIGRLRNLKVLNVANNRIVDFSMVDWGKIVSVFAEDQLVNLTLDIDWSEKVTFAPGDQIFKEPTISEPSYAVGIRNDVWFENISPGDPFYDGLDIVDLPGELVVKGLKNVDQTIVMRRSFGKDNNSNPVSSPRFLYNAEFKVKLNQVSKKVTFDNEGIESSNQLPVTDLIKEPTTPTKQGYAFLGWYDARSGGTKWDFATDKMLKVLIFLIYLQKYWDFFKLFSIII
ncbi:InlB B-repeat-containing protein, partial [Listeria monocytogenes]|nr:InlB B-repeat-containing protein [Listeria monocytogenes]